MWVQGEFVGLLAVALEKAGQRLAGIHDFEKPSVVDDLFGPVRRRRRRCHELEGLALEEGEECLVGLGAVAAEHGGLVER